MHDFPHYISLLTSFVILIFSVVVHEIAHGYAALKLGDPTAKHEGRLTLNPIPHLDLLGSFLLPGLFLVSGAPFLLGWAKPVPVNPHYFSNPPKGMMWTALAGPLSNLGLAFIFSLVLGLGLAAPLSTSFKSLFLQIIQGGIYLNIILAVFNLLPIPPLDGSKICVPFLPPSAQHHFLNLEPFGFVIIFALAYFNLLTPLLLIIVKPLWLFFVVVQLVFQWLWTQVFILL